MCSAIRPRSDRRGTESDRWKTTTEIDDGGQTVVGEPETQVLDGLRDAYRQQGYDRGYTRATRDVAALLVLATEEFIRGHGLGPVERGLLRDFLRYAERHVDASTPGFSYVEEGLGI